MMRALAGEFLKLKRSWMLMWTSLVVVACSALALAMLPVLSDPKTLKTIAAGGGVFAQAVAAGAYTPTWANYLRIGTQGMTGSWGVLTFSLVAAYLFGRESRERTASGVLTLPLRREYVVLAKMIVLAVWVSALSMLSVLLAMAVAAALGATGFAWAHVGRNLIDTLEVAGLLYFTLPFVAWFAALGRGYLRPMLFALAMMMVGNGLVSTSVSRWFPWNMPLHLVGASWYPVSPSSLTPGSWVVAVAVFGLGLAALMWRTNRADSVG